MAITNGLIVGWAEKKLSDESNNEFDAEDLVGFLNLATALICTLQPEAYVRAEAFKLQSGVWQSCPAGVNRLFDITMNMGTGGGTPGAVIRETTIDLLNRFVSGWTTATSAAAIQHFARAEGSDVQFAVYPPSDGTGYVMASLAKTPDLVVYDTDGNWESVPYVLGDKYANSALHGILFNAFDVDSDTPGNAPRADVYYQRLLQALGLKEAKRQQEATK